MPRAYYFFLSVCAPGLSCYTALLAVRRGKTRLLHGCVDMLLLTFCSTVQQLDYMCLVHLDHLFIPAAMLAMYVYHIVTSID